jgi:hypothetical protein
MQDEPPDADYFNLPQPGSQPRGSRSLRSAVRPRKKKQMQSAPNAHYHQNKAAGAEIFPTVPSLVKISLDVNEYYKYVYITLSNFWNLDV